MCPFSSGRKPSRLPSRSGLLIHNLSEHLHRQGHFLVFMDHGDHLHQRPGHAAGEHIEGDECTNRHVAAKDVNRTKRR